MKTGHQAIAFLFVFSTVCFAPAGDAGRNRVYPPIPGGNLVAYRVAALEYFHEERIEGCESRIVDYDVIISETDTEFRVTFSTPKVVDIAFAGTREEADKAVRSADLVRATTVVVGKSDLKVRKVVGNR